MAASFRIDQATPGAGVSDRSRHDLIPGESITLTATGPLGAGITYAWEIIDRAGSISVLSSPTGASVSIASSDTAPFAFLIRFVATLPGGATQVTQRIASCRTPNRGIRIPMFPESADAKSTLVAPLVSASTDNALYEDRSGTGQTEQNARGWAEAFWELAMIVDGLTSGGSTDTTVNNSDVEGTTTTDALNTLDGELSELGGAFSALYTQVNTIVNSPPYSYAYYTASADVSTLTDKAINLFNVDGLEGGSDMVADLTGFGVVGDQVGFGIYGTAGHTLTIDAGTSCSIEDGDSSAQTLVLDQANQHVWLVKTNSSRWQVITHSTGGAIDGDLVELGFVPTYYTRTPTGDATEDTQLESHLNGIDALFGEVADLLGGFSPLQVPSTEGGDVTSDYSLSLGEWIYADLSGVSATVTIALPAAASGDINDACGIKVRLPNTAHGIHIVPDGSNKIDGATVYVIPPGFKGSVTLKWNGDNDWLVIAEAVVAKVDKYGGGGTTIGFQNLEFLVGGFSFDPSIYSSPTVKLRVVGTFNSTDTGSYLALRLYDLGPGGSAFTPVLRSTAKILFASAGLAVAVDQVLAVTGSPGVSLDQISTSNRLYEVRAYLSSTDTNSAGTVGWGGIEAHS